MTDSEIKSEIRKIQEYIFSLQRNINERKKKSYARSVLYGHLMIYTGKADSCLDEAIRTLDSWQHKIREA